MTPLNTIIEEEVEAYKNDYAQAITDVGGFGLAKHIERFLTTAMQRAYEAAKVERDTYWKEQLQKAREREAYIWFDSWYAYYIKESLVGGDDFGTWASKRLQTLGADHSELDQDKK